MLIWCLQDNPPYNVSGKNGFVLHFLIIFKNGFQLPRNSNYPKNNYFVTSLLLVYLMDVQMLYSHYFIAPVMVDLSLMDVQESCTMGTAWYISLHMVSHGVGPVSHSVYTRVYDEKEYRS